MILILILDLFATAVMLILIPCLYLIVEDLQGLSSTGAQAESPFQDAETTPAVLT